MTVGEFALLVHPDIPATLERGVNFGPALTACEPGLTVAAGIVEFDQGLAIAAGLSGVDAHAVSTLVDRLNDLVGAGVLALGPGPGGWASVTSLSPAVFAGVMVTVTIGTLTLVINVTTHWWGTKISMNKAATQKLVEALNVGAGAAAVVAAVLVLAGVTAPAAAVAALVSALLWLGGAAIALMDFCNGVDINIPWGCPTTLPPIPTPR